MHFQLSFFIFVLFISFSTLTARSFDSDESDIISKVEAIKNELKILENEFMLKNENDKLDWQVQTFQKWFADETTNKCAHDLTYIFDGWMPIQRRQDGSVDFYGNWTTYEKGFGDKQKEFFIGFETLHKLTKDGNYELLVLLGDHDKHIAYAKYDKFVVGSNEEKYQLKELGQYTGTAGDSLRHQVGNKFTTMDMDNDNSKVHNCAKLWKGAWWFGYCYERWVFIFVTQLDN